MIVFYLNLVRRTDRRERFLTTNAMIADFCRWEAADGPRLLPRICCVLA